MSVSRMFVACIAFLLFGGLPTLSRGDIFSSNSGDNSIERFTLAGAGSLFATSMVRDPRGVAFDSAGNLYMANASDNTIIRFAPDGSSSLFASTSLDNPRGLAFDPLGNLYVANYGSNSIVRFAPDGTGSVFASSGVDGPIGLAFDVAGNLYVANYGSNSIVRFAPDGTGSVFASSGLHGPTGLAFDAAGNLYVANYDDNSIARFTPAGAGSTFASSGLSNPYGLAFDTTGNLYAANYGDNSIQQFTSLGAGSVFATSNLRNPTFLASSTLGPAPTPTPTASPTPTSSPTPTASTTPTPTASPTASPSPTPVTHPTNLSTRMRVQTGDNIGIGGFIITGSNPKHVLIRGIGPFLTHFGVTHPLVDPVLELHGPGAFVTVMNDNWRDTQEAEIKATGLVPTNDFESAIDATLTPGAYTAIVSGKNNTVGVALVEVYDLDQTAPSKLGNLSTRAFVSTEDDIVIAGFILSNNNNSDRIVVRGLGPSLSGSGLSPVLTDPTLELRDSNGALLLANNDWQDNVAQAAAITTAGLAPSNAKEAAIAATLPPGLYTALLAGLNDGTGIGLVEIYDLGPP